MFATRLRRAAGPLLAALVAGFAAACWRGSTDPDEGAFRTLSAGSQKDLDAARARWAAAAPLHYQFLLRRWCECLPEATRLMRVEVRRPHPMSAGPLGERAEAVTFVEGGGAVPENARPPALTVDQLFALIQDAIDRRAVRITIEYDASLGYPRSIAVDYDERIADEEASYIASSLEALP